MTKILSLLLLGLILFSGCSRRYTIVTNSGGHVASRGKPKLTNGVYVYRDLEGREATMPAGRVREIAPSSMVSAPSDKYPGSK